MTDYKMIDNAILEILSEVSDKFPDNTANFVKEFVVVGETPLAIETLCIQAYEYGINFSSCNKQKLQCIASLMNMKLEGLPGIYDA